MGGKIRELLDDLKLVADGDLFDWDLEQAKEDLEEAFEELAYLQAHWDQCESTESIDWNKISRNKQEVVKS